MGEEDKKAIVVELYRSFRERDNDAAFALYDEDVVWDVTGSDMLGLDGAYRGHEGIRRFWREWLEAWDGIEWEQTEPEELPDGRVVVRVQNQRNTGRGTGIEV